MPSAASPPRACSQAESVTHVSGTRCRLCREPHTRVEHGIACRRPLSASGLARLPLTPLQLEDAEGSVWSRRRARTSAKSRSRKKFRNVRSTAMAATRPTASQLVVMDVSMMSARKLKGEAGDQPARVAQPDITPMVAADGAEHPTKSADKGFDGPDHDHNQRQGIDDGDGTLCRVDQPLLHRASTAVPECRARPGYSCEQQRRQWRLSSP